jgi:dTDP-4-dehydrorhamnose 3,5-epimerase
MQLEATSLSDVILIRPDVFRDARGYLFESWQEQKFCAAGLSARFVQDNQSHSTQHTLRGLHYQVVRPQGKLVRVVRGSVYDVSVDIRRSSPTFGRWVGVTLSEENNCMLWIPPGFAHGFLVLSTQADVLYRCTEFWAPAYDRSLRWCDPELNIAWPLPNGKGPLLSAKDAAAPLLRDAECLP